MKTVAIFTTTRAEFGLFAPLIEAIKNSKKLEYNLFVGGTHLKSNYGETIREIRENKFNITGTFDYLLNNDSSASLSKSLGIATYELSNIFREYEFDFACVLGDRFELLSIIGNAILFKRPIIHIHGGEKTEGAIDEQIRHMVTKAAHIHFVACEEYATNIERMGEAEWRIYNTGALGIDNIVNEKKIQKSELFKKLNLDEERETVLMTYHPVTLEFEVPISQQVKNIFSALSKWGFQVVITAPNIETEREKVMTFIRKKMSENTNYHFFDSLGFKNYHSLIPHCKFVIGNSSSGIIEVPFFKIPTVNIGSRQDGRIRHPSVIDTNYAVDSIRNGITKALDQNFRKSLGDMEFKFGDGHAAEKMVRIINQTRVDQNFLRKKITFQG